MFTCVRCACCVVVVVVVVVEGVVAVSEEFVALLSVVLLQAATEKAISAIGRIFFILISFFGAEITAFNKLHLN